MEDVQTQMVAEILGLSKWNSCVFSMLCNFRCLS